jgi:hypothetical protein
MLASLSHINLTFDHGGIEIEVATDPLIPQSVVLSIYYRLSESVERTFAGEIFKFSAGSGICLGVYYRHPFPVARALLCDNGFSIVAERDDGGDIRQFLCVRD